MSDISDYDIPYNTSEDEYNDNNNDDNITPMNQTKIQAQETQKKQEPVKHKLQLKKKVSSIEIESTNTCIKNSIISNTKPEKKTKESKEIKLEENFEFNEETINFFTRDLDARKILIIHKPNSHILDKINDTKVICLLLKIGHFKDYHCNTPKCKVGKIWIDKPIQLILNRKNNIQNDLSSSNLELICANCFMVKNGLDIFIKKKAEIIMTCGICKFPLVKFKNGRKSKGVCISCEKQMSKISFEKQEDNYCSLLQNTYSDNPVLSDDIQHNKYYSEVSKYKKFDVNTNTTNTTNTKLKSSSSNKKNSDASLSLSSLQSLPLIELNMSMPNLFDLVDLDEEL